MDQFHRIFVASFESANKHRQAMIDDYDETSDQAWRVNRTLNLKIAHLFPHYVAKGHHILHEMDDDPTTLRLSNIFNQHAIPGSYLQRHNQLNPIFVDRLMNDNNFIYAANHWRQFSDRKRLEALHHIQKTHNSVFRPDDTLYRHIIKYKKFSAPLDCHGINISVGTAFQNFYPKHFTLPATHKITFNKEPEYCCLDSFPTALNIIIHEATHSEQKSWAHCKDIQTHFLDADIVDFWKYVDGLPYPNVSQPYRSHPSEIDAYTQGDFLSATIIEQLYDRYGIKYKPCTLSMPNLGLD